MNINDLKIAYAEVDKILDSLSDSYIEKIPLKLRDFFKENKNPDYKVEIDPYVPLKKQNLHRKTIIIMTMLELNYFLETDEDKDNLIDELAREEHESRESIINEYSLDNVILEDEKLLDS